MTKLLHYSISFGKILNIPLRIHWSAFLAIIILPVYAYFEGLSLNSCIMLGIITVFVLACVLLHELGHSIQAQRLGIKTHDIMLSVIGGIARLDHIPEDSSKEFKIAIAGPLVNLYIAIALLISFILSFYFNLMSSVTSLDQMWNVDYFMYRNELGTFPLFIYIMIISNLTLFGFNLLPVFPLDGGRILRAFLSSKITYLKATFFASLIGKIGAGCFVLAGIYFQRPIWSLVGMFVFSMAHTEYQQVRKRVWAKRVKVSDMLQMDFQIERRHQIIDTIIQQYLNNHTKLFVFLNVNGRIQGIIDQQIVENAIRSKGYDQMSTFYLSQRFGMVNINSNFLEVHRQLSKFETLLVMDQGKCLGYISKDSAIKYINNNK